jgi:hypothetical protein
MRRVAGRTIGEIVSGARRSHSELEARRLCSSIQLGESSAEHNVARAVILHAENLADAVSAPTGELNRIRQVV